jgi:opacity protein-like surface antigen
MKKIALVLILCAAALSAVSAFEVPEFTMAAGGGGFFSLEPGGGVEKDPVKMEVFSFGGGAYGFFDATFVEANVGFGLGARNTKTKLGSIENEDKGSYMALNIQVLGKFPFALSDQLSVFPLLGAEYQIFLSVKDKNGDAPTKTENGKKEDISSMDFNAIWFRAGGGLDFFFTENLFLRGEILYGIRLGNKAESDAADDMSGDVMLGHGGMVKVGVGFKF